MWAGTGRQCPREIFHGIDSVGHAVTRFHLGERYHCTFLPLIFLKIGCISLGLDANRAPTSASCRPIAGLDERTDSRAGVKPSRLGASIPVRRSLRGSTELPSRSANGNGVPTRHVFRDAQREFRALCSGRRSVSKQPTAGSLSSKKHRWTAPSAACQSVESVPPTRVKPFWVRWLDAGCALAYTGSTIDPIRCATRHASIVGRAACVFLNGSRFTSRMPLRHPVRRAMVVAALTMLRFVLLVC